MKQENLREDFHWILHEVKL